MQKYLDAFENITIEDTLGIRGPHKAILLIAIFECMRDGAFQTNKIFFNPKLVEKYKKVWEKHINSPLSLGMGYPFIQLGEEKFFHLEVKRAIKHIDQVWNRQKVLSHVKYGYFDDKLFNLLQNDANINKFEESLVNRYCNMGMYRLPADKNNFEQEFHKGHDKAGNNTHDKINDARINDFKHYLRTTSNFHGRQYSESTIGVYASTLGSLYIIDKVRKYVSSGNIFDITDKNTLIKIQDSIETDCKNNAANNTQKIAVKLYLKYIEPLS